MRLALALISLTAAGAVMSFAQRSSRVAETAKPEPLRSSAHWKLQFFHDKNDSTLNILDLKFPSPARGIALGEIVEKGKSKPTVLVTSNGGEKWDYVPISEHGVSLFFLNEQDGWLVTDRGIWKTDEAGRNWRKLASKKGVNRVCFTSVTRGFAVGYPKAIWETEDGGKSWKKVAAAARPSSTPEYTTYNIVEFANPKVGMILGSSKPPRRIPQPEFPAWMDPEGNRSRYQWPTLMLLLQTSNGGVTWQPETVSVFGAFTQLSLASDLRGLGLIEFLETFNFPSEVHSVDLRTGHTAVVFRRKDRSVTDVKVIANGPAYLAAVEPTGTLFHSPVPGKLKILTSDTYAIWQEMDIDYRASAARAVLASAGKGNVWVGTDTGMILRLVEH